MGRGLLLEEAERVARLLGSRRMDIFGAVEGACGSACRGRRLRTQRVLGARSREARHVSKDAAVIDRVLGGAGSPSRTGANGA